MMRLCIVEHKSCSESIEPGGPYWAKLQIDAQVDVYFDGARALGADCTEVLYDVLRKPAIRPSGVPLVDEEGVKIVFDAAGQRVRTKDGKKWRESADSAQGYVLQTRPETAAEFESRCFDTIVAEPDKYLRRATIVRLEAERIAAQTDTWQTACEIRDARRLKIYPRHSDSCIQWGRACDYFEICTGTTSADDPLLYKVEEFEHEELGPKGEGLLTQSSIRCYRSCPRRYYYRYVAKLRPIAPKAEPLRMGSSLHRGLAAWWKSGSIEEALGALDHTADEHARAKERAMIRAYHLRWEKPPPVRFVEQFFRMPLVNPETGAASRTFEMGGALDAVCEVSDG